MGAARGAVNAGLALIVVSMVGLVALIGAVGAAGKPKMQVLPSPIGVKYRQTVEVNLALVDDTALGGIVGALGGIGSHILALRKSEPSLEDVFVELVGRGFGDESTDDSGEDRAPGADDEDGNGRGGGARRAADEPNATDTTDDAREREVEVVG